MNVDHKCFECGFAGLLPVINRQIVCPKCSTKNDVWLDGQIAPLRHIILNLISRIVKQWHANRLQ